MHISKQDSLPRIPDFLISQDRWLFWKEDLNKGKLTKMPYSVLSLSSVNAIHPESWSTYELAERTRERHPGYKLDGIRIALGELDNGEVLVGLDLDTCIAQGQLAEWAEHYLQILPTYSERSSSGTGLKLFWRIYAADLPDVRAIFSLDNDKLGCSRRHGDGDEHPPRAELYFGKRYFTVTGQRWADCADEVALLDLDTMRRLSELFGAAPPRTAAQRAGSSARPGLSPELRTKLDAAFEASPRLHRRYHGDKEGLEDPSGSGVDMGLCRMLKSAGFLFDEMRAVVMHCEHGTGRKHESHPDYWKQMWNKCCSPQPKPSAEPEVEWEDPIDFLADDDLTGTPELRPDHIPEVLYDFAADTGARMGVDPAAVALGALVACASIVTDDWALQPKQLDTEWTEAPRLWGAIVGDPSSKKSPIIKACTTPIDRLEKHAREKYEQEQRTYAAEVKKQKSDEASTDDLSPPRLPRYLVENTTIEALSEVLRQDDKATMYAPAGKVLVKQNEMGEFFGNLDRYNGGKGGADRGAYLRLYDGVPFNIDRINRGNIHVPKWSACFLGGIQPDVIRRVAKETAEDGLLQRFIYFVSTKAHDGEDQPPNVDALKAYEGLFEHLAGLQPERDEHGRPKVVTLHKDALQHRESIAKLVRDSSALPDTDDRMKAALGKWDGIFARIALTCHLVLLAHARFLNRRDPFDPYVLSAKTAEQAASYMREVLLPHLQRAYAVMFASQRDGHARWIAGYILSKGCDRITARDINADYKALAGPDKRPELQAVMSELEAMGWVQPKRRSNPATRTARTAAWHVNPAVHTTFAKRAEQERARRKATRQEILKSVAARRPTRANDMVRGADAS